MKKHIWSTVKEADNYFSKRTGASYRWNKLTENERQNLLDKSLLSILKDDLYDFPKDINPEMKEVQFEQALYFLARPDNERDIFKDALQSIIKEKLDCYKRPELSKKKIKSTNWKDKKDVNQLIEGKYGIGVYYLRLSLVYINMVRTLQNEVFEREIINKVKNDLEGVNKKWKSRKEKYPSMKALQKFWPWPGEIIIENNELDNLIKKNIDKILKKLKSDKYSIPRCFVYETLRIDPRAFYIKPQNLIILTLAKVIKKENKTNWKVILELLNYIYHDVRRTNLGDVFDEIDRGKLYDKGKSEALRQICNKYTSPKNYKDERKFKARMDLIDSIYKKIFIEKISPFYKPE